MNAMQAKLTVAAFVKGVLRMAVCCIDPLPPEEGEQKDESEYTLPGVHV